MKKKIAILRGINVSGQKKILMADLKVLFEEMGFINVITYIQSGNIIFSSKIDDDLECASIIEGGIKKQYSFEVPTIVISRDELNKAIDNNPYSKDIESSLDKIYLTFLKESPTKERVENLQGDFGGDEFEVIGKNIFVKYAEKYSKSKLTNNFFESKLKVPATTRNWKTTLKLQELSK